MNSLIFAAALFGFLAGAAVATDYFVSDSADKSALRYLRFTLVLVVAVLIAMIVFPLPAQAATVAEIPGVAKFTTERGDCPWMHRVAIAPNGTRGCWTIGEIDRRVTIRWPDGRVVSFSETQFNIYAR